MRAFTIKYRNESYTLVIYDKYDIEEEYLEIHDSRRFPTLKELYNYLTEKGYI